MSVTTAKEVMDHIKAGWELWLVADSPLPGSWELRHARHATIQVHWDAIILIRRHYLPWFERNTVDSQEGRYSWCYRFRQAQLTGGLL